MMDPENSTDDNQIAAASLSGALNPQGVVLASSRQVCTDGNNDENNVKCRLGSESGGTVAEQASARPV